jgi:hypothetical protein
MTTKIYDSLTIHLIDDTPVEVSPLKIKYLREFMIAFEVVKESKNDEEGMEALSECVRISMKQYYPQISNSVEDIQDNLDMPTVYEILAIAAGIKINEKEEEPVVEQAKESGTSWEGLDLAALESEVFLLGIWKDYEELELSLSMPELSATLAAKRDQEYRHNKFLAAMQGVDLDKSLGKKDEWEEMKSRVFGKGEARDANDILSYQGIKAKQAGFGINMGLEYETI